MLVGTWLTTTSPLFLGLLGIIGLGTTKIFYPLIPLLQTGVKSTDSRHHGVLI